MYIVRDMVDADIESVLRLYAAYSDRPLDPRRIAAAIASYPAAVISSGSNAVGFYYCLRFAPDIVELANIFVADEHRRAGAGVMLLRHLTTGLPGDVAAVIAVNSMLNATREPKHRPDGFYARGGFATIATTPQSTVYWWTRPAITE